MKKNNWRRKIAKQKRRIEINIEENYVIFEDNPKKKVPITNGKINLDLKRKN